MGLFKTVKKQFTRPKSANPDSSLLPREDNLTGATAHTNQLRADQVTEKDREAPAEKGQSTNTPQRRDSAGPPEEERRQSPGKQARRDEDSRGKDSAAVIETKHMYATSETKNLSSSRTGERDQVRPPTSKSDLDEVQRLSEHIASGEPITIQTIMGSTDLRRGGGKDARRSLPPLRSSIGNSAVPVDNEEPYIFSYDHMKEVDFRYCMTNPRRGVAVIFNIGEFLPVTQMKRRNGYEVDGDLMRRTFTHLGFDVRYYPNVTSPDLKAILNRLSTEPHGDTDCFVCVIMTHGNRSLGSDIIFTKDGIFHLESIIKRFNGEGCPSLVGKPKLFFVQACRGDRLDQGLTLPGYDETDAATVQEKRIPIEADILLSQATTPGYISFRNSGLGSIYVRNLSKALLTYGHAEDILSVLTRVHAMVAYEFESNCKSDPSFSGKKQMPAFTCQLTKRLIFTPPLKSSKRISTI